MHKPVVHTNLTLRNVRKICTAQNNVAKAYPTGTRTKKTNNCYISYKRSNIVRLTSSCDESSAYDLGNFVNIVVRYRKIDWTIDDVIGKL